MQKKIYKINVCELYCGELVKGCKLKDEFVSENSEGKRNTSFVDPVLTCYNHTGHRVAGCLPIFVAGTLHTPSLQGNWTGVVSSWMDLRLGFKSRFLSW